MDAMIALTKVKLANRKKPLAKRAKMFYDESADYFKDKEEEEK
jgi:hypothetical protein